MTYGWAILIIAIVLMALFSLNLFNPYTFAPKASPGSCQIMRPNGPGSNIFVSEVGLCNNEIPQYVAKFNGNSSYIEVQNSISLNPPTTMSMFAWFYPTSTATNLVEKANSYGMKIGIFGASAGQFAGFIWGTTGVCSSYPFALSTNRYYFVGFTFNGTTITEYVNGKFYCSVSFSSSIPSNSTALEFGGPLASGVYVNGSLSNVQIYNTSLSLSEVTALYREGIGGAPTNIQNLVGWWPLNGNAKDYSGNNNNGVPTNVVFTSNWESGYSTP